ncbi:hypothetical protein [Brenneria izbisi]|uniref:Uncharacterized protein n=1 Tax=Brenneria izbisi TaxID=2939450 RepID=A0AA42C3I9_9GAMM|nr:hypothetical protein [Brenneria izbisi]MCV9877239.1 hypothetical protein [Brenneria izbisi]MCV9881195.1 hypothetical protein [Brenneria izbisi]
MGAIQIVKRGIITAIIKSGNRLKHTISPQPASGTHNQSQKTGNAEDDAGVAIQNHSAFTGYQERGDDERDIKHWMNGDHNGSQNQADDESRGRYKYPLG